MGQTLTHGVYLPDEGERNCYNGLASNWSILDGAVGTVAEHTTQIAGKAPLVHTHTKADITDFPVYGTTAGTICEGNDSRLSDARTPVAHTHTKSDVTDLLNSDFIPSANNTYNLGSSSYKWKTLNGINPGALSLPDVSRVTDIDTTGWTFNGSTANQIKINNATQTLNGWLYIRLSNITATDSVIIRYSGSSAANVSFGQRANANGDPISITVPVVANVPTYVYATAAPSQIRFFLSLGEVNNLPS